MTGTDRMTPHPVILWPFRMIWRLTGWMVKLVGCLLAIVLGLILMAAGVGVSMTGIGIIFGIPLFVLGAMLVIRGLF